MRWDAQAALVQVKVMAGRALGGAAYRGELISRHIAKLTPAGGLELVCWSGTGLFSPTQVPALRKLSLFTCWKCVSVGSCT